MRVKSLRNEVETVNHRTASSSQLLKLNFERICKTVVNPGLQVQAGCRALSVIPLNLKQMLRLVYKTEPVCMQKAGGEVLSRPQLWEPERLRGRATIKVISEVSSRSNKLCFRGWEVSHSPVAGTSK